MQKSSVRLAFLRACMDVVALYEKLLTSCTLYPVKECLNGHLHTVPVVALLRVRANVFNSKALEQKLKLVEALMVMGESVPYLLK